MVGGMSLINGNMKKKYFIRKNKEYRTVYNKGISLANRHAVIFAMENFLGYSRFGYSVSKKIGKAVVRNKVRRRLKEVSRECGKRLASGYDYIIIARKGIEKLEFNIVRDAMENLVYRINKKIARKN